MHMFIKMAQAFRTSALGITCRMVVPVLPVVSSMSMKAWRRTASPRRRRWPMNCHNVLPGFSQDALLSNHDPDAAPNFSTMVPPCSLMGPGSRINPPGRRCCELHNNHLDYPKTCNKSELKNVALICIGIHPV